VGYLHRVEVDNVAEMSEVYFASVFRANNRAHTVQTTKHELAPMNYYRESLKSKNVKHSFAVNPAQFLKIYFIYTAS
jgi:hypothetical protein